MGGLRVGLSGWSHPDWIGPFYPVALRETPEAWLDHYATRFRAVELTSTFHAFPGHEMVAEWARLGADLQTRAPFEFSLQLPREVTHKALVRGDREAARRTTGRFDREVLDPLAGEGVLGAVLLQLPSDLPPTPEALGCLQDVLGALLERRVALEPRDPRWLVHGCVAPQAEKLFESPDVCLVEADHGEGPSAHPPVHAKHAYLRFHGRPVPAAPEGAPDVRHDVLYPVEALRPWTSRVEDILARRQDVRVFFTNTPGAKGVENALAFLDMMGQSPPGPRPKLTEQTRLEV